MAFDADPSATHNPSAGADPPAAWGDILNANWAYLAGAWETYTPTWAGSGGTPAIGNGTLTGRFRKMGKTLDVKILLVWGSTTTGNTSTSWTFSLPSGVTLQAATAHQDFCPAYMVDNDTGVRHHYHARTTGGSAVLAVNAADGGSSNVGSTSPFTWATSDILVIKGTFELA